jgi:hypothetical protein
MSEWKQYCRGAEGLSVDGTNITVVFPDERRHRVAVTETGDSYELSSVVVRRSALDGIEDAALRAWRRNRVSQLVGFRIDHRERLVGEAWVPRVGLRPDEFVLYVRRVASECDLLEYHLTGRDIE